MGDFLSQLFPNDPTIPDETEAKTHLYVAGLVAGSLLFLVLVRKGMGSAAI